MARYKIIKRRVIWVIGEWVDKNFDRRGSLGLRPTLYQILVHLLGQSQDMVVRITASTTLKKVVDDFAFKVEDILPVSDVIMASLFQLLCDVDQCDSKMAILDVTTLLFDRLGDHVCAHTESLAKYLPELWQSFGASEEYGLVRNAIVRSLVKLVDTLGPASIHLYAFLLAVVHESVDPAQTQYVYLRDDALELWHGAVKQAPTMTAELMELFASILPLLQLGDVGSEGAAGVGDRDECLLLCIKVVESYVLLGQTAFLEHYGAAIFTAMGELVGDLGESSVRAGDRQEKGSTAICRLCDTILILAPEGGLQIMQGMLTETLSYLAQQYTAGTLARPGPHIMLLSRVMLVSPQAFVQLAGALSGQLGGDVMNLFFDVWIDKFENISDPSIRKLCVLALAHTMTVEELQAYVHPRFAGILSLLVEGLCRLHQFVSAAEFQPVGRFPCALGSALGVFFVFAPSTTWPLCHLPSCPAPACTPPHANAGVCRASARIVR